MLPFATCICIWSALFGCRTTFYYGSLVYDPIYATLFPLCFEPLISWINEFQRGSTRCFERVRMMWTIWVIWGATTTWFVLGTTSSATWPMTTMFAMRVVWATGTAGKFWFVVGDTTMTTAASVVEKIIIRFFASKDKGNSHFLPDLESFDEWLSTELDRLRWLPSRFRLDVPLLVTALLTRLVADLTDLGLEFIPNKPRWCDRIQGTLLLLCGESGAL